MNLCLAEPNAPTVRKHRINSFESSRTLLLNQSLTFGDCADDASLLSCKVRQAGFPKVWGRVGNCGVECRISQSKKRLGGGLVQAVVA